MRNANFKQFLDKNLLVLSPAFSNKDNSYIGDGFVKNQLAELKQYFNEISVISPVPFSFNQLAKDKHCINYEYDNVKVYYPRSFYIPILYFKSILIDNRLRVIKNLVKQERLCFDLIHAHFTWPSAYIAVALKEIYNKPVVVTIHENEARFYKEINMDYQPLTHSLKKADALIRVNKKDLPLLKEFNENVFSIPNGYPSKFKSLDQAFCRGKLGLPADKKIIFSLGLLIERKGFKYLIEALKLLGSSDILCFIGGRGSQKKLQSQISNHHLEEQVFLIGFIPDELLPIWMNACDLFVLPSLSEGNPTVMFEALGCGVPFVGSDVGGVSEIIISEDYGYLTEPKNSKNLAEKIELALAKQWDKEKIQSYAEQFTWENIGKEILNVYCNVRAASNNP